MRYFPLWDVLLMHLLCVLAVKLNVDLLDEAVVSCSEHEATFSSLCSETHIHGCWCPGPCDWWFSWLSSWLSLASRQGDKFWPVVGQQRTGRTDRSQSAAQRGAPVRTNGSDALSTSGSPCLINFPPYTERSQPQVWRSWSMDLFYDRWMWRWTDCHTAAPKGSNHNLY